MKTRILIICTLVWLATAHLYAQRIGLLMDSYVVDRWYLDQKLFTERVNALGGECIVEVPHGDPDEQVRLGQKLIDSGVDALVVVASDSRKAVAIVEAAKKKKIPVISYDRLILSDDVSFYISFNNMGVGNLQAEYVLKRVPRGKYLLINGPPTDYNAVMFRNGQMEVLQPHIDAGEVEIVGDIVLNEWSEIEALMRIDELFATTTIKPDAIIAANDALATGTLQAMPSDLLGHVVVTGQDAELMAIRNIISGVQTMTVYKPIRELAHRAAEIAMDFARGKKPRKATKLKLEDMEVDAILLNPVVVDKQNYKATVVQDGHVSMSELHSNIRK
ncbi:MAG: substrate-binding domain-containing protein [Bacteroidota bacterium]|jgi:D-xylose transport system substrate-binding protein|nr:MAG: D-xylose transporter subunit XylF [Bacteroidota bacterium]